MLKGDWWTRLSQDAKVAYVMGASHVVEVEHQLMELEPTLRVEDFSAKVAEGESIAR